MNVYVESNFVLQLALEQEEFAATQEILEIATQNRITLVLPAFAISEPFSKLSYRSADWGRIGQSLQSQIQTQLRRSQSQHQIVKGISDLITGLTAISQDDNARPVSTVQRLTKLARIITLDTNIFIQALSYSSLYGLSIQDSIIYASVISDLRTENNIDEKCFVSTNSKDFSTVEIKNELKSFNYI